MPRRNPDTAASRRTEIVGMLRAMPTRWRRAYNTARRTLSDNGGPVLPDVPTPEQAMLILGNTAGRNRDIDQPTGDQRVPQGVRDEAMHGLRLSYKNDYAGWEFFGIARAIQLVLVPGVPMRTRERMKRYLEAHQKDKLAPHYGDEEKPSKGYMAMLNWGGDEGRAWNDDVKRATYSARTRGEAKMPTRRKNPFFARQQGRYGYAPVRETQLAAMRRRHGEGNVEVLGTAGAFWTPERMESFLNRNPSIRNRRYATREQAVAAVEQALLVMGRAGQISGLPNLQTVPVSVHGLATAVPLLRDLGHYTEVSSDGQRVSPYRVALLTTPHDERTWERGMMMHAAPVTRDFGEERVPPWVLKYMVRPLKRRVRDGDIVYRIPSDGGTEDLLDFHLPYKVLSTIADPDYADASRSVFNYVIRPVDTASSRSQGIDYSRGFADVSVNEWEVLREDEMPSSGDYPRPAPPLPARAPAAAARTRAAPAAAPTAARTLARAALAAPAAACPVQPTEALTAAAIAMPRARTSKRRSEKPEVIAIVSQSGEGYPYALLLDADVLKKGELSEDDVLGYANASYQGSFQSASIGVAAAEPGFAYLMYATLANTLAQDHPGAKLKGSNCQTEYAKRFWARQPGGSIPLMPPADFRQRFGTTYADLVDGGNNAVRRLTLALGPGTSEGDARNNLNRLGRAYFEDYYGVSLSASQSLGPDKLPRPAAPRETVAELRGAAAKKLNARDLAFIVVGSPNSYSQTGYLLSVPSGQSTLTPANLLARVPTVRTYSSGARDMAYFSLFGRLKVVPTTPALDAVIQALREYNTEVETARTTREVAKWVKRGDALVSALASAGITDLDAFFGYVAHAARQYQTRASRIAAAGKQKLNPRRDKLAVRIFMPV